MFRMFFVVVLFASLKNTCMPHCHPIDSWFGTCRKRCIMWSWRCKKFAWGRGCIVWKQWPGRGTIRLGGWAKLNGRCWGCAIGGSCGATSKTKVVLLFIAAATPWPIKRWNEWIWQFDNTIHFASLCYPPAIQVTGNRTVHTYIHLCIPSSL